MKKEGYSRPGLFGTMKHYDANGNKIGESTPGFFGGMNNYDAMLDAYPSLQNMYSADDGNTEVFYFKNATATFSSFTNEPEVVKF